MFHSRDKEHDAEGVTSNPDDDPTSTRDDTEKYLFGDDVSASSKHIYTDVQAALCIRLLHQHNTTGLDEADVDGQLYMYRLLPSLMFGKTFCYCRCRCFVIVLCNNTCSFFNLFFILFFIIAGWDK